jgi:hypothetical protein
MSSHNLKIKLKMQQQFQCLFTAKSTIINKTMMAKDWYGLEKFLQELVAIQLLVNIQIVKMKVRSISMQVNNRSMIKCKTILIQFMHPKTTW